MRRDGTQILSEWLVLKAQGGHERAFGLLVEHWYPKLLRYAGCQLQDSEAARDVVQETLVDVSRSIRKLRDPSAFPKWIYQILSRRCSDHQRREISRRHLQSAMQEESNDALTVPATTDTVTVRQAIRALGVEMYQVIHLHYIAGFTIKEISAIAAIPEGTVKSRLHKARNQLREILGEQTHE